jgi:AGZA family xanthine/uracil permease-like MFS transporter
LFVSVFDAAGVMFAAGQQAKLLDEHHVLPNATQGFFSAGLATSFGALFGTSPVIVVNETCAGIQ